MPTDLEAAWDALHDATPPGWFVGRPSYDERFREWVMYAFDPPERPQVGHRSRDWTAVAGSEVGVALETARCLRLIGEGRGRSRVRGAEPPTLVVRAHHRDRPVHAQRRL